VIVDVAPAEVEVPHDLVEALVTDPGAAAFFAGLTASQRKSFIAPIEDAKTADTRTRRVERALAALQARQKRP